MRHVRITRQDYDSYLCSDLDEGGAEIGYARSFPAAVQVLIERMAYEKFVGEVDVDYRTDIQFDSYYYKLTINHPEGNLWK